MPGEFIIEPDSRLRVNANCERKDSRPVFYPETRNLKRNHSGLIRFKACASLANVLEVDA
jgi:hypothetical protein